MVPTDFFSSFGLHNKHVQYSQLFKISKLTFTRVHQVNLPLQEYTRWTYLYKSTPGELTFTRVHKVNLPLQEYIRWTATISGILIDSTQGKVMFLLLCSLVVLIWYVSPNSSSNWQPSMESPVYWLRHPSISDHRVGACVPNVSNVRSSQITPHLYIAS